MKGIGHMPSDYARIEKAINYIDVNQLSQPNLDDLASHLRLSPFHFQRLFRRWVGISPKRFLQYLTIEHAKSVLDETRSLLDATYESGLSSPGRLYDLFVTIDAVTPGQYKQRGAGLSIAYGMHESPFGKCLIAITERGICGLAFANGDPNEALQDLKRRWPGATLGDKPRVTRPYANRIFNSERRQKLPLHLHGTNFQVKVWEALIKIPPGHLCTYEDVARNIGNENAIRAVGNAVATNPISYLIPCHRVIRKMGIFGEYHWGATRKKAIIGWEAARRFA
jgi:AraC family transcriptional regulator of adaptative response/methylated-DNA-[protein]-cysteine methyltransferase